MNKCPYLTKKQIVSLFKWYYHADEEFAISYYNNALKSHSLERILDAIYNEYGDELFYKPLYPQLEYN